MAIQNVVAGRVKQARKGLGLTQAQLAERMGTTWHSVSRWERAIKYPTVEEIVLLAELSGRSPDWFLRAEDAPRVTPRDALEILQRHFDETKGDSS
jgi:transcriptional regulator with XRE-family HTH domain